MDSVSLALSLLVCPALDQVVYQVVNQDVHQDVDHPLTCAASPVAHPVAHPVSHPVALLLAHPAALPAAHPAANPAATPAVLGSVHFAAPAAAVKSPVARYPITFALAPSDPSCRAWSTPQNAFRPSITRPTTAAAAGSGAAADPTISAGDRIACREL